jgi:hypothetical protein
MRAVLRHIAKSLLSPRDRRLLSFDRHSADCLGILEHEFGHDRSRTTAACVDRDGRPIPWYTYPAIEYLVRLDFSATSVFEFGSGNSTLYWGSVARHVMAVESDQWWYETVRQRIGDAPIRLVHAADPQNYVNTLASWGEKFDVIVIDGKHRGRCAREAPQFLKSGGLVILDNADWYPKACRRLREAGLLEVDMSGFGPINDYTWTTSLFFDRQFRVAPRSAVHPTPGIGALVQSADDDA